MLIPKISLNNIQNQTTFGDNPSETYSPRQLRRDLNRLTKLNGVAQNPNVEAGIAELKANGFRFNARTVSERIGGLLALISKTVSPEQAQRILSNSR